MSQFVLSIVDNIGKVPDLPQHIILEFLGYKFHHGNYSKQFPRKMEIYELLMERTQIIHSGKYNIVVFDIKFMDHRNNYVVKTMEICYTSNDKNVCYIFYRHYAIEFDDSRHFYYIN
jgi:hypothetical protein